MSNSALDLIILLLSEIEDNVIVGKLKFHKLLFLLLQEGGFEDYNEILVFKPYKLGPWTPDFDPLIQLVEDEGIVEIRNLRSNTELLFENHENEYVKLYRLTDTGKKIGQELREIHSDRLSGLQRISSRFGNLRNEVLLRYVYSKYDSFKDKSIIKNEVSSLSPEEEFKILLPDAEIESTLFSLVGISKSMSLKEEKEAIDSLILGGC